MKLTPLSWNGLSLAIFTLGVAAFASTLSGCASGPRFREIRSQLPAPGAQARVFVFREPERGLPSRAEPRLNGEGLGNLKPGTIVMADTRPGRQRLELADAPSDGVDFPLHAGETRYVRLRPHPTYAGRFELSIVSAAEAEAQIPELAFQDSKGLLRQPAASGKGGPELGRAAQGSKARVSRGGAE